MGTTECRGLADNVKEWWSGRKGLNAKGTERMEEIEEKQIYPTRRKVD